MAIKTGAIKAGGSEIYPHTALDQIRKSATSSTTLIALGGVIQKDYLDLTGLISASYVSSANIIPVSAINGLPTAVNNAASTYVNSFGVIPTSAVVDLPFISSSYALFDENGWTRWVSAGAGVTVTENSDNFPERDVTVALRDYDTIETLGGNTVVLSPGKYYRLDATTGSKTISINSFGTTQWGRESYMELFVANTGYVVTNANVFLTAPLEPNSVNNCVIKFRNGFAIISVEDHIGGYIVISSGSGSSTSGTLAYGVKSSTSAYIAFNGALNSAAAISFGGVTANGVKRIVGNGYGATTLTGSVNCGASGCTVRNLSLQNVGITGGTMTLGDVFIHSGSTVSVSGGVLAIEKVEGTDGTINLGGTHITALSGETMRASGLIFTNGSSTNGGAVNVGGQAAEFYSCTFSGNTCTGPGGAINIAWNANARFVSCTITGNTSTNGGGLFCDKAVFEGCIISGNTNSDIRFTESRAVVSAVDCTIGLAYTSRGKLYLMGSNHIGQIAGASATLYVAKGAVVDITGATATTTINPGGGITFESGGATVKVGDSTASSSYMMGNVTLPAGAKLTNTNVVNLGGTNVIIGSNTSAYASGCVISGGNATSGGAFFLNTSATLELHGVELASNTVTDFGGAIVGNNNNTIVLDSCYVHDNTNITGVLWQAGTKAVTYIQGSTIGANQHVYISAGKCVLAGSNSFAAILNGAGDCTVSSGAVIDLTGNANASPIAPGGGITFEQGGARVLYGDVGSASSMFIDNLKPTEIRSGGVVYTSSGDMNFPNSAGASAVISGGIISGGRLINRRDGTILVKDATIDNQLVVQNVAGAGTVKLAGTLNFTKTNTFPIYNTQMNAAGKTWDGVLEIASNTMITTTYTGYTAQGIGTLIVGSGVTLNGNPVSSGTFTSASLNKNGTITEA